MYSDAFLCDTVRYGIEKGVDAIIILSREFIFVYFPVIFDEAINEASRLTESKRSKWRVLVVDNFSMKVISSCCSMQDIAANGVTIVEDLHKKREPLQLEAIYLITPNSNSVKALLHDLDAATPMYQAFYIYPLERKF